MRKQLCPEGNHWRPSTQKHGSQKKKDKKPLFSYSFLTLETCTPQYFLQSCTCLSAHIAWLTGTPICFITPQTHATNSSLQTFLSFSLFHSSVWRIAKIQLQIRNRPCSCLERRAVDTFCLLWLRFQRECTGSDQRCFCFCMLCRVDVLLMARRKQVWPFV